MIHWRKSKIIRSKSIYLSIVDTYKVKVLYTECTWGFSTLLLNIESTWVSPLHYIESTFPILSTQCYFLYVFLTIRLMWEIAYVFILTVLQLNYWHTIYSPNEIQESCHLTPLSPRRGEKNCKSSVGVAYFLVIYFTHICSVKVFSLRKITQNVSLCKITQNGTFMRAVQRTLWILYKFVRHWSSGT